MTATKSVSMRNFDNGDDLSDLVLLVYLPPLMEEKVQNTLRNRSCGKFYNFIQNCTTKFLVKKNVKIPATTVQKGILNFFFHVYLPPGLHQGQCCRGELQVLRRGNAGSCSRSKETNKNKKWIWSLLHGRADIVIIQVVGTKAWNSDPLPPSSSSNFRQGTSEL